MGIGRFGNLDFRDGRTLLSCAAMALLCTLVASLAARGDFNSHHGGLHLAGVASKAAGGAIMAGQPISLVAPQALKQFSAAEAQAANAQVPFSTLPNPPAKAFNLATNNPDDRARALTCLTMAVYYEAANQGPDGEAAVAQVVLNRLRHPLFPKTVCGVVFEGASLPTGCQFTFACDGSLARRPSAAGWKQAAQIAERALDGYVQKSVGEATHYHTVWVVPYWQSSVVKLTQIGAHIFYRWPGGLGEPSAFQGRYAGAESAPPPIMGFDTGLEPAALAKADAQAPPPIPTPLADSLPVTPAIRPVEVAMLTPNTPPTALAETVQPAPEKPRGFFGRGGGGSQRLPVAGW
jgi:spore germination cell wall hydrolase CwlJ-like protein